MKTPEQQIEHYKSSDLSFIVRTWHKPGKETVNCFSYDGEDNYLLPHSDAKKLFNKVKKNNKLSEVYFQLYDYLSNRETFMKVYKEERLRYIESKI